MWDIGMAAGETNGAAVAISENGTVVGNKTAGGQTIGFWSGRRLVAAI